MNALLIDPETLGHIKALCAVAHNHPINMPALLERLKTAEGKLLHMAQMSAQTLAIPTTYMVTFSVETGHPMADKCRHMSMSTDRVDRLPNQLALWMVAQEFGFWGALDDCTVWFENLKGHGRAVNLVQEFNQPETVGTP